MQVRYQLELIQKLLLEAEHDMAMVFHPHYKAEPAGELNNLDALALPGAN